VKNVLVLSCFRDKNKVVVLVLRMKSGAGFDKNVLITSLDNCSVY